MKVSLNWLREWVDVGNDVAELSHALTMAGLEIEGQSRAADDLQGVVVAEVRATQKHPDAEKLNVCRVFDGRDEIQIVCGASNVRPGIKVPLATVGATLPGGVSIKAAKLRGVDSFGMLCSAKELGLVDDVQGLLELPSELVAGTALMSALDLNDVILEINLTPNRGDCMSVLGVAREVAAAQVQPVKQPAWTPATVTLSDTWPVTLQAAGCRQFLSRVVRGVNPQAKSPWWLRERLRRAGVRPLGAIVDVTNYVMLELGQPMHAYDAERVQGGLVVRMAHANEALALINEQDIKLTNDVMVIADQQRALGMAGVMGGSSSAISANTTQVLLEVASFEPDAIAGRGRRYGLVTDASQRFERGVDPNGSVRAMERATQLLLEIAGGQAGPIHRVGQTETVTRNPIRLRAARVTRVLGVALSGEQIVQLLTGLGLTVQSQSPGEWQVTPPSWRFDIAIEEDLIEEVARRFGYDHIPTLPAATAQVLGAQSERQIGTTRMALALVDRGYQEAITYSFTEPKLHDVLFPGVQALTLANPISAELAQMRLSLWPGLLQAVQGNLNRQQPRVRLFESGRLFSGDGRVEQLVLAGVVTGPLVAKQWATDQRLADFFDVKADVEAVLALAQPLASVEFRREAHDALHPGQTARIYVHGQPMGWLGALHPRVSKALDLPASVFVFELNLDFANNAQLPVYKEISKFPGVRRDLALVVDQAVSYQALHDVARAAGGELLKELSIFDMYQGAGLENGKKSMALGLFLQDTSRTLTDAEVEATITRVVASLQSRCAAQLRDR